MNYNIAIYGASSDQSLLKSYGPYQHGNSGLSQSGLLYPHTDIYGGSTIVGDRIVYGSAPKVQVDFQNTWAIEWVIEYDQNNPDFGAKED